jgi:hypothetical protein
MFLLRDFMKIWDAHVYSQACDFSPIFGPAIVSLLPSLRAYTHPQAHRVCFRISASFWQTALTQLTARATSINSSCHELALNLISNHQEDA